MIDLSSAPRTRVFTTWETALYVDVASGQLRHGPIGESPANAYFIMDPDSSGTLPRGWLVQEAEGSLRPIVCKADRCDAVSDAALDSPPSPTVMLQLIKLERGLVSFESDGTFLTAQPDGTVVIANRWCSLWEFFLPMEDWCASASADGRAALPVTRIELSIDTKNLRSYIVRPSLRVRTMKNSKLRKVLIFGHTQWSHGRVNYDLCKHLWEKGLLVDLLDWQKTYPSSDIEEIKSFYDLFITSFDLDGLRVLTEIYGVPYERIIAISHSDFFQGTNNLDVYHKFAGYGVVSYSLVASSLSLGISRVPKVVPLGINFSEFNAEPSDRLQTVGYASSTSLEWMKTGIDRKRGELARECAREAGLEFKTAGSSSGPTSFHDMPEFYTLVDCILMTSLFEAAPLPVMEAAAAGRLVIGTPVGHFPLKAYQGGGIMAPIEAEKFKAFTAAALRYYKENPAAYVAKCRAIQEAARKFDWQYSIGEWIELIEVAAASLEQLRSSRQVKHVSDASKSASDLKQLDIVSEFRAVKSAGLSSPSPLCHLMTSFGSDKGAPFHNYTVVYDRLFAPFRDKILTIFELGLGTSKVGAPSSMGPHGKPGASLRGWRTYFPYAQIFGADIDADILFEEDRIRTFWVDQRDREAVRALWN